MDFLPYGLLAGAVLAAFFATRRVSLVFLFTAAATGFAHGRLDVYGLISLTVLFAPYYWLPRFPLTTVAIVVLSTVAYLHLLPGFANLKFFDQIRFAPDSLPFTMYLNFDKTAAGLLLCLFLLRPFERKTLGRTDLAVAAKTLAILVLTLLPAALVLSYVRLDMKLPAGAWLWTLNNLLFVCMAEEALFRGAIQGSLSRRIGEKGAIMIGALLFGAAHFKGGPVYVALAAVAGLFYGAAFARTGKLQAAVLVHFGLNLIHFLFFSYPALAEAL